MKFSLSLYIKGIVIGTADIIPGVSGGTFAFLFGIYDRLITSLSSLRPRHATLALRSLPYWSPSEGLSPWQTLRKEVDFELFLSLGLGVFSAVLVMSRIIPYFLTNYPAHTLSLFLGLVAFSVLIPLQQTKWNAQSLMVFVGFFILTWLALAPDVRMEFVSNPLTLFGSGALAICSMLLPGISGSYVLVVLGAYPHVLTAVRAFDLVTLAPFLLGIGFGLIGFSHLLKWLLTQYRNPTHAALTGFLAGSLRTLWPGKYLSEPLSLRPEVLWLAALMIAGFLLMFTVERAVKLRAG